MTNRNARVTRVLSAIVLLFIAPWSPARAADCPNVALTPCDAAADLEFGGSSVFYGDRLFVGTSNDDDARSSAFTELPVGCGRLETGLRLSELQFSCHGQAADEEYCSTVFSYVSLDVVSSLAMNSWRTKGLSTSSR